MEFRPWLLLVGLVSAVPWPKDDLIPALEDQKLDQRVTRVKNRDLGFQDFGDASYSSPGSSYPSAGYSSGSYPSGAYSSAAAYPSATYPSSSYPSGTYNCGSSSSYCGNNPSSSYAPSSGGNSGALTSNPKSNGFYITVQAGSGDVSLLFDTGSEYFLVNQNSYDGSSDPEWSDQGASCQIAYGAESASYSGELYTVPVEVDGGQADASICLATSSSPLPGDGVFGVNLQLSTNTPSQVGWSSFGVYLSIPKGVGQVTPNGVDSSYFASGAQLAYESLVTTGQAAGRWSIGVTSFSIGSTGGTIPSGAATLDTGSPPILLDPTSTNEVYSQIDFTGYTAPMVNCNQKGVAPPLTFTFASGAQYTLTSSQYILQHPDGSCKVMVVARPAGLPALLGGIFMSSYYADFDVANSRIGLAASIG